MSSNFREEAPSFWKRDLTGQFDVRCLVAWQDHGKRSGQGPIRAYPKDPELGTDVPIRHAIRSEAARHWWQQRRADNLAIACFIEADRGLVDPNGPDLGQTVLQSTIRAFDARRLRSAAARSAPPTATRR